MPHLTDQKFAFIEVVTPAGITIEVRERRTGRLVSTIGPDLFAYMLERAWKEASTEGR